jgi:hypothetical protein
VSPLVIKIKKRLKALCHFIRAQMTAMIWHCTDRFMGYVIDWLWIMSLRGSTVY